MSSSKIVYNIEFLRGFKWAVPTAFSSAISQCQFEEGDIFYDSKEELYLEISDMETRLEKLKKKAKL